MANRHIDNLLKDFPTISAPLAWSGFHGVGNLDDFLIEHETLKIYIDCSIYNIVCHDGGDRFTPPSLSDVSLDVEDVEIKIFNHRDKEIKLEIEQENKLIEAIKNNIITL